MGYMHPSPVRLTPLDNIVRDLYVNLALYFPASRSDATAIQDTLRSGLTKTLEAIPVLAGTVVVRNEIRKGTLAVAAPWRNVDEILTANIATQTELPDYDTQRSEHFPAKYLQGDLMPSLPSGDKPEKPVMLAQLNFIKGGIILGICLHHSVVDGTGNAIVNSIWAAHCRGEDYPHPVDSYRRAQDRLMKGPGVGGLDEFPDLTYLSEVGKPAPEVTAGQEQAVKLNPSRTEIFFFPKSKLRELKEVALGAGEGGTGWISTIDALSSLLWCCTTAARKSHADGPTRPAVDRNGRKDYVDKFSAGGHLLIGDGETSEPLAILGIVMNGRRFLHPPLPQDYIGNVTVSGGIAAPISSVTPTRSNVGRFAMVLRQRINSMDEARIMRMINAINSVPDVSRLGPILPPSPEFCVFISSWSTQSWYDMDWGSTVGGAPERVRLYRPFPPGATGFCFVMPELTSRGQREQENDGLEVVICLSEQDMTGLKKDELFSQFAKWRCN
ncbi:hypothetical protein MMC21_007847 [Puttea exsequens]|nr:hypothetical protein [Puttea exsequens]